MKMYGEIQHRPGVDKYKLGSCKNEPYFLGDGTRVTVGNGCIVGCSGKANQLLNPHLLEIMEYGRVDDVMSWGYEGKGSDMTAAYMIATALYGGATMLDESRYSKLEPWIMELVHRHYKQFSQEVIANLPDEWEMDMDWVKQWVAEKESQAVKHKPKEQVWK